MGGGRLDHGLDEAREPGQFYPWRIARMRHAGSFFSSHVAAAGIVEAFVCRRCGLTELYTRDPESIEVDGDLVREIIGPAPAAPYR